MGLLGIRNKDSGYRWLCRSSVFSPTAAVLVGNGMCGVDQEIENYLVELSTQAQHKGQGLVEDHLELGNVPPFVGSYRDGPDGRSPIAELRVRFTSCCPGFSISLQLIHESVSLFQ